MNSIESYQKELEKLLNQYKKEDRSQVLVSFNQSINDMNLFNSSFKNLLNDLGTPEEYLQAYLIEQPLELKKNVYKMVINNELLTYSISFIFYGLLIPIEFDVIMITGFRIIRSLVGRTHAGVEVGSFEDILRKIYLLGYFIILPILIAILVGLVAKKIYPNLAKKITLSSGIFYFGFFIFVLNNSSFFAFIDVTSFQKDFYYILLGILFYVYFYKMQNYFIHKSFQYKQNRSIGKHIDPKSAKKNK